jgi:hypothetical protein
VIGDIRDAAVLLSKGIYYSLFATTRGKVVLRALSYGKLDTAREARVYISSNLLSDSKMHQLFCIIAYHVN